MRWARHVEGVPAQRAAARDVFTPKVKVDLIFDPLHTQERIHANLIAEKFNATKIVFPMAGHELLASLARIGVLRPLISGNADANIAAISDGSKDL